MSDCLLGLVCSDCVHVPVYNVLLPSLIQWIISTTGYNEKMISCAQETWGTVGTTLLRLTLKLLAWPRLFPSLIGITLTTAFPISNRNNTCPSISCMGKLLVKWKTLKINTRGFVPWLSIELMSFMTVARNTVRFPWLWSCACNQLAVYLSHTCDLRRGATGYKTG